MIEPASPMSPEFTLAAACCIWPPSERRKRTIETAAARGIDWDRMSRLVARHRVAGLVHHGLMHSGTAMPTDFAQAIAAEAHEILRTNLATAAETVRLHRLMTDAGIPRIFFKGTTLALLAYGGLGMRHAKDIDFLVDPESVPKATELLEDAGYRRFEPVPNLGQAGLRTFAAIRKDYAFKNQERQTEVELHWRLFDNHHLMPGLGLKSQTQNVRVGESTLPTFAGDDLFAYLCMHGALTGWFRLKWLADVSALLTQAGLDGGERLYRACLEKGAGQAAAQAILLCHRLLSTDVSEGLLAALNRDPNTKALERTALWAISPGSEEKEPMDVFLGGARINFSHLRLRPDWRYRASELKSYMVAPDDLVLLPLPAGLHVLYPVLRLPLWLWRRRPRRAR